MQASTLSLPIFLVLLAIQYTSALPSGESPPAWSGYLRDRSESVYRAPEVRRERSPSYESTGRTSTRREDRQSHGNSRREATASYSEPSRHSVQANEQAWIPGNEMNQYQTYNEYGQASSQDPYAAAAVDPRPVTSEKYPVAFDSAHGYQACEYHS